MVGVATITCTGHMHGTRITCPVTIPSKGLEGQLYGCFCMVDVQVAKILQLFQFYNTYTYYLGPFLLHPARIKHTVAGDHSCIQMYGRYMVRIGQEPMPIPTKPALRVVDSHNLYDCTCIQMYGRYAVQIGQEPVPVPMKLALCMVDGHNPYGHTRIWLWWPALILSV